MSDKMREAFEAKFPPSKYIEWCDTTNRYQALVMNSEDLDDAASHNLAWRAWQSAQSAAVPVVGDVVAWKWHNEDNELSITAWNPNSIRITHHNLQPLIVQPTTSITADELERLQRNDARYLFMRNHTSFNYSVHKAAEIGGAELDRAIDAAIAGEKNHG